MGSGQTSTVRPFSRVPRPLKRFDPKLFGRFLSGKVEPPQLRLPAVGCFSSAGVGDFGFRLAGFTFKNHAEKAANRLALCRLNHPRSVPIEGDLRRTWPDLVDSYREQMGSTRPALLTGMSPCQGLSTASSHERIGSSGEISKDPRNLLGFILVDVARELRPRAIVMENVPAIVTTRVKDEGSHQVGTIASLLAEQLTGYHCFPITIQFADFGVPQRRQRTLLTFIRRGEPCLKRLEMRGRLPYPRKTHDKSGRLGRLPWITSEDFLGPPRFASLSSYSEGSAKDPSDPLHHVPVYARLRFGLVKGIPPYTGRSAYQNRRCPSCGDSGTPRGDAVCASCQAPLTNRPIVLTPRGARPIIGHATSYKRMPAWLPVGTITTASGHLGSDAKIHPWENRLLSPRECAAAQTIPSSFRLGESGVAPGDMFLRGVIGEAIPPWFTYLHGLALRNLLGHGDAIPYLLSASDFDVEDVGVSSVEERGRMRGEKRARVFAHALSESISDPVAAAARTAQVSG